jgi:ribose transport system substrate-binding protein
MSAKARFLGVFLAGASLFFCGCSGNRDAAVGRRDSAQYYLVSVNTQVPYWKAAGEGFSKAAAELQVTANIAGPQTYDVDAEQKEFQRVAGLHPAGILVSPANPEVMKPQIDAAIAAGIPVITVDADAPSSKRLTFVGTDNYEVGRMGGEILSRALGANGSVLVFTMPQQANLEERYRGYMEILAAYPHITVLPVVDVKGDPQVAQEETDKILSSRKAVNAFICLEALACKGVAKTLSARQVTGKTVIAMDSDPETLEWISKGLILGTIAQKPFTMGFVGLKLLDDLHRHPPQSLTVGWAKDPFAPVPSFVNTGVVWIDKQNVGTFASQHGI